MSKVKKAVEKIKGGFLKEAARELNWIYKSTSGFHRKIFLFFGVSMISSLISLSISYKSKSLVDLLVGSDWKGIMPIVVYYVLIGSCNVCLAMCIQRTQAVVSGQVKKEICTRVYDRILDADWETVARYHSGDLMARMNEDVGTIAESVVGWIPSIFIQGIQLVISLGIIIYYDFSMLVVIACASPIIILGSRIFLGKVYEENRKQREVSSEINSFQKETFQNMQAVKAFGLSHFFQEKMEALQNKRYVTDLKANKYSIASWAVMYVSGQFAALVCLGWAFYHVYTGYITLGTMTLMVVFAATISASFKSLIQMIPGAMSTITSAERIRLLLELPREKDMDEEACEYFLQKGKKSGISIQMKDIDFSYKEGKQVFSGVNIHAEPGEIVALVGPSGEGKTTMLRLILGILNPKAGKAYVFIQGDGDSSIDISPGTRRMIAYVPQGNALMNGTIAENMRMVHPDISDAEIEEVLEMVCALDFVKKLPDGINHRVGESGVGFSEGQIQRLSIARALLCRTPLLLLDEATSALDVATERKVLSNIMKKDPYRTCILTTHRPTVLSMCNRVYRIAEQSVREINEDEIHILMNDF